MQGHHAFASSSTLYGRDDISPLIVAHDTFIQRVIAGWRARTPMLRGVTFLPSEPTLHWPADLSSVTSIAGLAFFRFSDTCPSPASSPVGNVPSSSSAGLPAKVHSTTLCAC